MGAGLRGGACDPRIGRPGIASYARKSGSASLPDLRRSVHDRSMLRPPPSTASATQPVRVPDGHVRENYWRLTRVFGPERLTLGRFLSKAGDGWI
jgi:hypothetical protein